MITADNTYNDVRDQEKESESERKSNAKLSGINEDGKMVAMMKNRTKWGDTRVEKKDREWIMDRVSKVQSQQKWA